MHTFPERAFVGQAAALETIRVGVAGATGYAGQELLRLLARHPRVTVVAATSSAVTGAPRPIPALSRIWDGSVGPFSVEAIAERTEAAFLALPDPVAAEVAPRLVAAGCRVFDLSGAFRLRDPRERARWYPESSLLSQPAAYGLPERRAAEIRGASLVACPGCYPTAAVLALGPLADADLLVGDVIIDAKSGVSGAGKAPSERTHFSECHGSVAAYNVFNHRHTSEIEQELGRGVTFVPHLVPLDRGILATIYGRVQRGTTEADLAVVFEGAYRDASFVRLTGAALPEIKHVAYTNFCDIGWRVDSETGRFVAVSCLDNLGKGAAGQAIQNFNIAFGLDEREGLLA
jgi:N-acetyl-gamma-glutamyl-phosphate reductase